MEREGRGVEREGRGVEREGRGVEREGRGVERGGEGGQRGGEGWRGRAEGWRGRAEGWRGRAEGWRGMKLLARAQAALYSVQYIPAYKPLPRTLRSRAASVKFLQRLCELRVTTFDLFSRPASCHRLYLGQRAEGVGQGLMPILTSQVPCLFNLVTRHILHGR